MRTPLQKKRKISNYITPEGHKSLSKELTIDSPMTKALLGKTEDDEIVVKKPNGTSEFVITAVRY